MSINYEEAKKLLDAIFKDDKKVEDMFKKALEWKKKRALRISSTDVVDAIEVAQMSFAEDMAEWDSMDDDEKDDLATLMLGISLARDMLANEFGMKSRFGKVEKHEG